jgi:hypothetical protein
VALPLRMRARSNRARRFAAGQPRKSINGLKKNNGLATRSLADGFLKHFRSTKRPTFLSAFVLLEM